MVNNSAKMLVTNSEIIENRVVFDSGAGLFNLRFGIPHNEDVFDYRNWHCSNAVNGGRGSVWFVGDHDPNLVLRHFRRGGAVASVLDDKYVFRSQQSTRSFSEFRLLAHMWHLGLPVPEPCAAWYGRQGVFYRARIITRRLKRSWPWSHQFAHKPDQIQWSIVGKTIAQFHRYRIDHADLNVNNILMNEQGQVYLIDFDKGMIRSTTNDVWRHGNLRRLKRSIVKLLPEDALAPTLDVGWNRLLNAYRKEFSS